MTAFEPVLLEFLLRLVHLGEAPATLAGSQRRSDRVDERAVAVVEVTAMVSRVDQRRPLWG